MKPRLIAIDGPLRGETIELSESPVGIGRGEANAAVVADPSASRQHCEIVAADGRYTVRDLGSRNGTFVNRVPVRERVLEEGDEIKAGKSVFRFVVADSPAPSHDSVVFQDGAVDAGTVVLLPQDASVYLEPEDALDATAPAPVAASGYRALLRISAALLQRGTAVSFSDRLLECLLDTVPASAAAVLLSDGANLTVRTRDRVAGPEGAVEVNRTLVDRALQDGVSLLSGPALVVPLQGNRGIAGAIYLSSTQTGVFTRNDLQIVAAAGVLAGFAIDDVRRFDQIQAENELLEYERRQQYNMVGDSAAMQTVYRNVARVAASDSTVLITGETGAGKELVARAIHLGSSRAQRPFVAINSAALTESLLESELFGHERGAFTGAVAMKKGKLEVADGGSLFLDEIAELPLSLQAKLLRVLQEREFERVGGTRSIRVDIRLIAATNRDLHAGVRNGTFRQDLLYRLDVVRLKLPPLRERREDIPLLANYFLSKYAPGCGRKIAGISKQARACLEAYQWPGNVRELQNAIERAVVLGSGELIMPEDLPEQVLECASAPLVATNTFHGLLREQKAVTILSAIEASGGNMTEAARRLNLNANYLHRLVNNLGLRDRIRANA